MPDFCKTTVTVTFTLRFPLPGSGSNAVKTLDDAMGEVKTQALAVVRNLRGESVEVTGIELIASHNTSIERP